MSKYANKLFQYILNVSGNIFCQILSLLVTVIVALFHTVVFCLVYLLMGEPRGLVLLVPHSLHASVSA